MRRHLVAFEGLRKEVVKNWGREFGEEYTEVGVCFEAPPNGGDRNRVI